MGTGPGKTSDAIGDPVSEPVAVLDLGANSFHLLVGGLTEDGSLGVRARSKHMVRLGSAMGRAGDGPPVLGEEAAARGHEAIRSLVQLARLHSPIRTLGVATSIFREAADAAVFLRAVHVEHAIPIEVLTGDAEARLTYFGAVGGLPAGFGVTAVVEVGGGSVQIAVGTETDCRLTASLPLGVVRLRQRLRADGVLRPTDVRAITALVRQQAKDVAEAVRAAAPRTFILAAGTARALASLVPAQPGGRLSRQEVASLVSRLRLLTPAEVGRLGVEPARQDTLAIGAVVIATLMEMLGASSALVSDRGLREGVLAREVAKLPAAE